MIHFLLSPISFILFILAPSYILQLRMGDPIAEVVYPDERFANLYGTTMARLRRQGDSIATMDLLIATAALADRDTLITRNLKDFRKIKGLRIESY